MKCIEIIENLEAIKKSMYSGDENWIEALEFAIKSLKEKENLNITSEIIKRIEEHKAKVSRSTLLNSHEYDLKREVEYALAPYDVCISIINQAVIDIAEPS